MNQQSRQPVIDFDDGIVFDVDQPAQEMDIVHIDVESIEKASIDGAKDMINNVLKFYDHNIISKYPYLTKKINDDIESIRMMLKMRKINEETQNTLISAISLTPGNASLYRALTEVQKTILSITSKIEETVKDLNTFIKTFVDNISINGDTSSESDEQEQDDNVNITRGSKIFIAKMNDLHQNV